MYCPQCGEKLRDGARFCPSCGYPVHLLQDEISKHSDEQGPEQRSTVSSARPAGRTEDVGHPYEKSKGNKRILIGFLVVLLTVGIGIGGFFGIREYQFQNTLSDAGKALAGRNFEEAITLLEDTIQMRPQRSDSYLTLAQAHVELGNLYAAKHTLDDGYAATGDETLQCVSLWGPLPAFEVAMWASESMPLTRQEYYFGDQDFVQGYIRAYGNIMFVINYYFDRTGNVVHAAMTDYTNSLLGVSGVNRTVWETGWPFMGEPDISWNYDYDTTGNIISADMNGDVITISEDVENNVVLANADDQIIVRYDSENRPVEIVFYDGTGYDWNYREDGSYIAEDSDADYQFEFNDDGLFIALIGDDADAFTLKLDSQNRVESVDMEDNFYQYNYSETGYLDRLAVCDGNGSEVFSEDFSYDNSGNLIQMTQYTDQEHTYTYQMEYNSMGKLIKITFSDSDQNILQDTVYEYEQDGRLEYYVLNLHSVPSDGSDDILMVYIPGYDEYGMIERYTSGQAVYTPGTYIGSADGFGGEVTVEVTVDYMKITNIEVVEQNETAGIGPKAFDTLTSEILNTGSPNVDSVTGATISSQAFLDAIDDALQEARLYQENSQSSRPAIYDELDGKTFIMASGVGNWSTEITFDVDGLFQGTYHDFDMGDTATEYPNGTCYVSGFSGTMGNVEQIDENTYSMEIVDLFFDELPDGGEITDGVRYVEATYDIEYGDTFELYCPGRSTADLSEEFMTWLRMPLAWAEDPEVLPVYGLYNLRNGDGFFSNDD